MCDDFPGKALNLHLRPAATNPLFTANSEQFTTNRSVSVGVAYIKATNVSH
ncbi:MAG TPA: hypothetical protein VJ784_04115 [Pyrinomonadaceae bacterium]|nr:hypothetical protein [Pyrinomonadaceae bacterium]